MVRVINIIKKGLTLYVKLSIFILILFIISFSLFGSILIKSQKDVLEQSYIDKTIFVAKVLDTTFQSIEDVKNKDELLLNINKNIWLNPDIIQINVNIITENGLTTFASNKASLIDTSSDPLNEKSINEDKVINEIIDQGKERVLRTITPIHISGQNIGTYEILVTLEELDKSITDKVISLVMYLIIILIIFAFVFLIYINSTVVKPIMLINHGTKEISNNPNYRLKIKSSDEIGELASAFNQMADSVKENRGNLEKSKAELEKRVEELEKWNKYTIGRELKMIALKKKIKELEDQLNKKR